MLYIYHLDRLTSRILTSVCSREVQKTFTIHPD